MSQSRFTTRVGGLAFPGTDGRDEVAVSGR